MMAIECYESNCEFHSKHSGEEGPFCFETECKVTHKCDCCGKFCTSKYTANSKGEMVYLCWECAA